MDQGERHARLQRQRIGVHGLQMHAAQRVQPLPAIAVEQCQGRDRQTWLSLFTIHVLTCV